MLYNINNNNYISVLDIQLWMMHCLLIYYRDHYTCQNYWLQNFIFTCICMSCMLNPINLIIPINVNIVIFIILPIMGVFNWQINIFYSIWNMTWHILWHHWRMTSKVRKRTSRNTKNENEKQIYLIQLDFVFKKKQWLNT